MECQQHAVKFQLVHFLVMFLFLKMMDMLIQVIYFILSLKTQPVHCKFFFFLVSKYLKPKSANLPIQLKALQALYEDVHCRYSLSSAKLIELLEPLFNSDISNVAHMQAYLNKNKDNVSVDQARILTVYEVSI